MTDRLVPPESEAAEPFWDATREQRLLVQWCGSCREPIWFPRAVCPRCLGSGDLLWRESSGLGRIYAVSVQHRAAHPGLADAVPYAVALVEVDAGDGHSTVRVMTNVLGGDPSAIAVGDPVLATWEALPDGRNLLQFAPL